MPKAIFYLLKGGYKFSRVWEFLSLGLGIKHFGFRVTVQVVQGLVVSYEFRVLGFRVLGF